MAHRFAVRVLFGLTLIAAQSVFADTRGKISGTIVDIAGSVPMAGVNVFISAENLGAITNAQGFYSILNIPPGKHTVSASFIGYKLHIVQDVLVSSDQTTNLNINMETAVLEGEEVIVTAERPLVQADLTSTRSTITSDDIKALPNESFQALLATKAGVTVGSGGAIHIRGGRASEVLYMLDGIAVTNPFSSGLGLSVSTNMISELTLVSGTFNAEYGRAMSGIINLVTRDGGSEFDGNARFQTGDMYSQNTQIFNDIDQFTPLNFGRTDLSFSGPLPLFGATFMLTGTLQNNKGWLYGYREHNTWDYASLTTGATPYIAITGDSSRVPMNANNSINVMGKITLRPWSSAKLTYQFTGARGKSQSYNSAADHGWRFNPDGRYTNESTNRLHALHFSQTLSSKTYFTIKLADKLATAETYVHKLEFPYTVMVDTDGDDVLEQITVPDWDFIRDNGAYLPNDSAWYSISGVDTAWIDADAQWYTVTAWAADSSTVDIDVPMYVPYNYPGEARTTVPADHFIYGGQQGGYFLSDHTTRTFKFDFTSQIHAAHQIRFGAESNQYRLHRNNMSILLLESRSYQPYVPPISAAGLNHDEYTRKPFDFAVYFQDKIELENVIIQAGIRFDYFDPRDSTFADFNDPRTDTLATVKSQISPRLGVSFPINDRGYIRFSYGHFFKMPGFTFLYQNPDLKYTSSSYNRFGNPNLEPERTVMYEVGLQQQISPTMAIDATMFYRDIINWLSSEYHFIDNELRYTRYITRDYGNVRGVTLSLVQRASTGLSVNLDYTFLFAEGNASSPDAAYYDNLADPPRESEKKVVPLDWDVRTSANATLSYRTQGGLGVSLISKFSTGLPYTPTTTEGIRNAEENAGRKPVHMTTDFQALKNINMGRYSLQVTLKVYNLFDRLNERFVFDDTGRSTYSLRPTFAGDPAEIYPELVGSGIYSIEERLYTPTFYRPPRQVLMSLGWSF
ncbi:MAG: TonB-dependent receptor [Candidatus Marinimicrobia bacterium]|nr:TonB-dependent receptor [Candidatus Neomarinimicrobiota bacterium]